ncbi:MAG TPA: Gfo/Idh/MocA family oxidoreductase [Burkholderiaceae bacterium]|jgi:predicted dehydrogenase|nr:Gfo/Idh/MocA family oxidoreductase [Burkholderiaceae bacterium]
MNAAMHAPGTPRRLRCAMVGGGRGAFIGHVHRMAMALDGGITLVSAALSSDPERARASGRDLGLPDARNHASWQELLAHESTLGPDERADFVCIVTPNHLHHEVALACVREGFHVVCDKPLVPTSAEASALVRATREHDVVFGVTYNYSGYPMVRQARDMVARGEIGAVRKVVVEYHQGWLATAAEHAGNKQAEWRVDPARSGIAGAMGDIGSHCEQLVATVTGLRLQSVCADLTAFGAGRVLDDDASVLLRFEGGARGALLASQIAVGCENDLRLRVFGTLGSLTWHQEDPNRLLHAPVEAPPRVLTRGGPGLCDAARRATRLPSGHPEGFIEAFANLYRGVTADITARLAGHAADPLDVDYPRVEDGARGVRFIEATVASSRSDTKWMAID